MICMLKDCSRAKSDTIKGDDLLSEAIWYEDEMDRLLTRFVEMSDPEEQRAYLEVHLFDSEVNNARTKGREAPEKGEEKTWADVFHYSDGFRLFEVGVDGPQTILDLALLTGNKRFTSHDMVQKFLDDIWKQPGGQPDEYEKNKDSQLIRVPTSAR